MHCRHGHRRESAGNLPLGVGRCESGTVASRRLFSALLSFSSLPYASKAASSAHKISRNLSRREVQSSFRSDNFCSDKEKPAENTCVFSRGLTQYGRKFRGENRLCPTYICLTQYRGKGRFSGLLIPTVRRPSGGFLFLIMYYLYYIIDILRFL